MKTSKRAGLTALLLVCLIPVQAQWELGGILGVNITGINVVPEVSREDYGIYPGIGIGVVLNYLLSDKVDLHMEPMLLQKGGRVSTIFDRVVYKINYFEIPFMLRYFMEIDSDLVPYVMAGPSIGILARATYRYDNGYRDPATDATSFFDLGAGIGGGLRLPWEDRMLFAEARYLHGFVNVNAEPGESEVRNRGVQILVGIAIPVGD